MSALLCISCGAKHIVAVVSCGKRLRYQLLKAAVFIYLVCSTMIGWSSIALM